MPLYLFSFSDSGRDVTLELSNDDAAWSMLVTTFGEFVREVDGRLKDGTEWYASAHTGSCCIGTLRLEARRKRRGPQP